ncbi:hypothetical protein CFP56_042410 [Quercus suber]|uniref:Uncharacterized protein n=1 Tax=Quercus suber TaxID=58331 RepID=A0AAW0IU20_QUESU
MHTRCHGAWSTTVPLYGRGDWPIGPKETERERERERERELSALITVHFFLSSTPVTELKNTRLSLQHYLHRAQQKISSFSIRFRDYRYQSFRAIYEFLDVKLDVIFVGVDIKNKQPGWFL